MKKYLVALCLVLVGCNDPLTDDQKNQLSFVSANQKVLLAVMGELCEEAEVCANHVFINHSRQGLDTDSIGALTRLKSDLQGCQFLLDEDASEGWVISVVSTDSCFVDFQYLRRPHSEQPHTSQIHWEIALVSGQLVDFDLRSVQVQGQSYYKETRQGNRGELKLQFEFQSAQMGRVVGQVEGGGQGNWGVYESRYELQYRFPDFQLKGEFFQRERQNGSGDIIEARYSVNGESLVQSEFQRLFQMN